MKKVILSVAVIMAIGVTSCKNKTNQKEETKTEISNVVVSAHESFGVRGNCGMCKKTIEKAANSVTGVAMATWDVDKKKIEVSFDDSKTDLKTIHNAIASSGYDTEKVAGSEEAYNELPGCCKYDHTMKMNQTSETKIEDHSGHNH